MLKQESQQGVRDGFVRWISSKLVYKFNLVLVPLVVIGFILATYLINTSAVDSLNQVANKKIQGTATVVKKSIESWLLQNDRLISVIAANDGIESALSKNADSIAKLNEYFLQAKQLFGFRNVALLDENGIAIAASNGNRIGKDYSNLDYFKSAIRKDITVISDPRLSRVDGAPLLTIAIGAGNNRQGVFFASLPLSNLYEDLVNSQQSDPDSLAFVLTSKCEPLAHPKSTKILSEAHKNDYIELCRETDQLKKYVEDDVEYKASVQRIQLTDWYLISSVKTSSIQAISDNLTVIGRSVGAVIAIILIIMFTSISRSLTLADDVMDAISKGDISLKTIDQDLLRKIGQRQDELGHIAHSLDKLIVNQEKQANSAKAIASGDLSIQPHVAGPDDILGQSFMTMVNQLQEVLSAVNLSSEKVLDATEKMYEGSKVLTDGANTQAEAVDAVANALNKMEQQVEVTTQASLDVRENSRETVSHADEGQHRMSELNDAIDNLNHTGKKISEIMNNITNIASQTNLIALNAAIEAARAGEHGRGFAVVADEVRKLASLTAEAAEDSNQLIAETLSQMETGKTLADATSETFHLIVDKINISADQLAKVSESHIEQNKTANDLHDAIKRIEVVAKDNLSISRKTIDENNALTSMSEELVKTAAYFSNTDDKSEG